MNAIDLAAWARPAVDAALLVLMILVMRRLGDDPTAAWRERETALRTIFEDLRGAIAQAEGLARDLDDKLAHRATEIRGLLADRERAAVRPRAGAGDDLGRPADGEGAAPTSRRSRGEPAADLAARVRALAASAMPVEDIARRLDVSAAEVRLLIGIDAAAARAASPPNGAAAGRQR